MSRDETASSRRTNEAENAETLPAPTIGDVILARFSRREALRGLGAVAALATLAPVGGVVFARNVRAGGAPPLDSRRSRTGIPRRTPSPTAIGRRR